MLDLMLKRPNENQVKECGYDKQKRKLDETKGFLKNGSQSKTYHYSG